MPVSRRCLIELGEMAYSQTVDIAIVSDALTGEELAEIGAVGTDGLGQLGEGQVVLQVELRVNEVLLMKLLSDWLAALGDAL